MDFRSLFQKRKKVILFPIYIVYLLLLIEVTSRGFWTVKYGVPFWKPEEIIYVFYPELREVKQAQIHSGDGYFDILLLGGSVLVDSFGNIRQGLLDELASKTKSEIRIHNLAATAHTSLDSYYKYKHLLNKNFDLVLFYNGINEVRANNVPPSLFESDYSHYAWYEKINAFEKHDEISLVSFPYTFKYFLLEVKQRVDPSAYASSRAKPKKEWVEHGGDIKTAASFENNLINILEIAKGKKENVFLMTFSYHVPEDYSETKFENKSLDYSFDDTLCSLAIEFWGKPENVVAGISAHNAIIEDVAERYNNVTFIDQNKLIPKKGQYFNDICHFTYEGRDIFVDNISQAILEIVRSTNVWPMPLAAEPLPQNRVEVSINDELVFLGYDLSKRNPQPGDQLRVTTYWQSVKEIERDYAIQVELRNGGYKVRNKLGIAPPRLWKEGRYYRGDAVIAINPHLLGGTYSLNLRLERDDGIGAKVDLISLEIPWKRRHILKRTGKANSGGSGEIISPDEPFPLRQFDLKEREALELVAGWTGKAREEETRVEIYISNAYWRDRYLGTWVVESGDYRVTKWKIGKVFTAPGENTIELRVPEVRERVHNIGWRGVVDRAFPNLLQDPRTNYDGPIKMDFAQVSTRWEGNWDDYYDLAKVYAERQMDGEVARLYEEAVDKGVEPGQVDDFALFKGTYAALGEEGRIEEIEERIADRIAHKVNVNLGDKVEFLGHSLRGKEEDNHGVSLFFRRLEKMEEDYTLWVHGEVEDESLLEGQRREAEYALFDHLLPTSRWQVGEVYQDDEVRGLRPGRYHFTLGLWRPEDGSRLWWKNDPNAHVIDLGWVEVK